VQLICRRAGSIADEDSELNNAINDYLQYTEIDYEYFTKVANALDGAIDRLQELRQKISTEYFDSRMPTETEPEPEPETKRNPRTQIQGQNH
jgi:hypothetical protein